MVIKKEARILGLSAPKVKWDKVPVVGIVFRGSLWLDGVLTCWIRKDQGDYISPLARAIRQSKQYSQIRAVILSRADLVPGNHIDIAALADVIGIPVMAISDEYRSPRKSQKPRRAMKTMHYGIKIRGRHTWVKATGISYDMVREIFGVSCAEGRSLPEAVRVADVVARSLKSKFYGMHQVTLKRNPQGLA